MANLNREVAQLRERVDSLYIVSNDELARVVAEVRVDAKQAAEAAARVDAQYRSLVEQFGATLAETRRTVGELGDRVDVLDRNVSLVRLLMSKIRAWAGAVRRALKWRW